MFAIVIVVILALTCSSTSLFAELRELKRIRVGPHSASWTFFDRVGNVEKSAMAVSASGDLYIFSSTPDGKWELSRIRYWSDGEPEISHLLLPGYFTRKDRSSFDQFDAQLLLTLDGRYVVCIGRSEWDKKGRRNSASVFSSENVITVVNVRDLTIEQSKRTSDLGLFDKQSFGMTNEGRLFVNSMAHSSQVEGTLVPLDLPSLHAGHRCEYKWSSSKSGKDAEPIPITIESCAQALYPLSLEQFLSTEPKPSPALSGFSCGKVPENLCPQPNDITLDQRFGIGIRAESHFSILGERVWRGRSVVAFSTRTRSEIGEIDLMRNSVELLLSSLSGKDYLLILWPNSELAIYELLEDKETP
jgi:hypothetical protein